MLPSRKPAIPVVDFRAENTFYAGLEPARGSRPYAAFLIVRNQVVYPLMQGLFWALAKDWFKIAQGVVMLKGQLFGQSFGASVRAWLSSIASASMAATFGGGAFVTEMSGPV